jgi:hypothetical protein
MLFTVSHSHNCTRIQTLNSFWEFIKLAAHPDQFLVIKVMFYGGTGRLYSSFLYHLIAKYVVQFRILFMTST